eukprot:SAG11_NODE_652_length_7925_cov_3.950166_4_plen_97_part_00
MVRLVNQLRVYAPRGLLCSSWEARYPGAVRATNTEILDAYLLKSLDGGLADGNVGVYAKVLPHPPKHTHTHILRETHTLPSWRPIHSEACSSGIQI